MQTELVCRVTGKQFHPVEGSDGKVYCSECRQVIYEAGQVSAAPVALEARDADSSLAK